MTYTTTAGRLCMDQWDAEIEFTDRLGVTHRGTIGEIAHYTHPDVAREEGQMPRTTSVRFVGEPRAVFLDPSVQVTVAGDKPTTN